MLHDGLYVPSFGGACDREVQQGGTALIAPAEKLTAGVVLQR